MRIPSFLRRPEKRSWSWPWSSVAESVVMFGTTNTKSGSRVDPLTAVTSNALAACLVVRSKTMGSLPVNIIEDTGTKRLRAVGHASAGMLRTGPNERMTWAQFMRWRELMIFTHGNAYLYPVRRGGRCVGMEPLLGSMLPMIANHRLVYAYRASPYDAVAVPDVLAPSDVIHFKSDVLTEDGLTGRALIELAREAIGLDISAEEFIGRVLSNGTHMGTVLATDGKLDKEQLAHLTQQLKDGRGLLGAGKGRIFQGGLKPVVVGMSVKDADLTNIRRYVNERISAICSVPLGLINDLTHMTYSNAEQQDITYSKHDIMPTCVDCEQTLGAAWFVGDDAGRFYLKFNLNGLQRGDYKTRMEGYEIAIRIGLLTPNDCLDLEDMDGYEGGDVHVMQMQMMPVADLGKQDPKAVASRSLAGLLVDATERIRVRAEQDRERKRDPEATRVWGRSVLTPLEIAHEIADVPFDVEAVLQSALSTGGPNG